MSGRHCLVRMCPGREGNDGLVKEGLGKGGLQREEAWEDTGLKEGVGQGLGNKKKKNKEKTRKRLEKGGFGKEGIGEGGFGDRGLGEGWLGGESHRREEPGK